jgi:uncharacterized membrane protein YccF (DUF307 family)
MNKYIRFAKFVVEHYGASIAKCLSVIGVSLGVFIWFVYGMTTQHLGHTFGSLVVGGSLVGLKFAWSAFEIEEHKRAQQVRDKLRGDDPDQAKVTAGFSSPTNMQIAMQKHAAKLEAERISKIMQMTDEEMRRHTGI